MHRLYRILLCVGIGTGLYSQSSAQDIQWQQVLGGVNSEYLYDMKATPDYGFLLAGSSFSGSTGNKADSSEGNLDYFLWKMKENGNLEWQKSFGGSGSDFLYSVNLTKDGGFILGGSSDSPRSGDKKEDGFGLTDFWILKLNAEGKEEWQLTMGGSGNDYLQSIQQTPDGGYIIGGNTSSPVPNEWEANDKRMGLKQAAHYGNYDYWVVKLNASGKIEWEKTYGGLFSEQLKSILILEDGYLLAGHSNSMESGNKSAENFGLNDLWLVEIDVQGNLKWDKSYGGSGEDLLGTVIATENGYLLAATSDSSVSQTKSANKVDGHDLWVLEINRTGEILWDNVYDFGAKDYMVSAVQAEDGTFLLGAYRSPQGDKKGENRDYLAVKISQRGELLWSKILGGNGNDRLNALAQTRDGGYLLAGNSNSPKSGDKDRASIGGNDYWILKLGNEDKKAMERKLTEVYPNPTYQFVNLIIGEEFTEARLEVFDLNGRKLQEKKLPYQSNAVDLQSYPPGVYVFKMTIDDKVEDVKVVKKGNK